MKDMSQKLFSMIIPVKKEKKETPTPTPKKENTTTKTNEVTK